MTTALAADPTAALPPGVIGLQPRWSFGRVDDSSFCRSGGVRSLSLLRNLLNGGVARGLVKISATCSVVDKVIGKMNSGHVVTEGNRRHRAGLTELQNEILHPLKLCEGGG
ncbi:hypothetical protein PIB30_020097 [Stylosanthes scabra]|uniref:Uncharacterized protein n=1 Tax=Stylosanthes scabra TaxID=79078 RepID=A0ABU6W8K9_9FABA|nr:hypothetical protein [Stylosanthes scabra]